MIRFGKSIKSDMNRTVSIQGFDPTVPHNYIVDGFFAGPRLTPSTDDIL